MKTLSDAKMNGIPDKYLIWERLEQIREEIQRCIDKYDQRSEDTVRLLFDHIEQMDRVSEAVLGDVQSLVDRARLLKHFKDARLDRPSEAERGAAYEMSLRISSLACDVNALGKAGVYPDWLSAKMNEKFLLVSSGYQKYAKLYWSLEKAAYGYAHALKGAYDAERKFASSLEADAPDSTEAAVKPKAKQAGLGL